MIELYELHENEQYFFDQETLDRLSQALKPFNSVCCLCAPRLGEKLAAEGRKVSILDIDTRFQHLAGFRYFDLHRPAWIGESFDLIVCDPPFFNISLARLFTAIRVLAQNNFAQPLLISYLQRRAGNLVGTFAKFGLVETDYSPTYQTVQKSPRNEVRFFSNIPFRFSG